MILVTGGTGLVGSHLLLDLLRSEEKVRAIYRKESSFEAVKNVFSYYASEEEVTELFSRIEWVKADITDVPSLKIAFTNVTVVYHCAALVSFDSSKDLELRKTNIEGTANIVNFCIKTGVEKLCFVSSIATLDQRPGKKNISETSFWNKEADQNMYAITKYGAEMEVWRASQEGVPVVIANPGVILGPGFWNEGSGKIFSEIQNGLNYYFPNTTGFVGVQDVVKAMTKLMASDVKSEQYILVSENLSFKEVFGLTAKSLGKPAPSKKLKPWMIFMGWLWQEISGVFSNNEKQLESSSSKSLFEHSYYSSQKIQDELGFEFEPIEKVIARTAEAYRKDLNSRTPT